MSRAGCPSGTRNRTTWTCSAPQCGRSFERYASQVRNPSRPFCSKACAAGINNLGAGNPNYRDGRCLDLKCVCDRTKDFRAIACAVCAKRGYPAAGQVRPLPTASELEDAVSSSPDLTAAATLLAMSRQVLTRLAREAGLDLTHMTPGRGRCTLPEQVFILRDRRSSGIVRAALRRLEPESYQCTMCSIGPEWNGLPLTLQMDHINGNPGDDRRENLRWLCPNCHSQTETYKGRNAKRVANV